MLRCARSRTRRRGTTTVIRADAMPQAATGVLFSAAAERNQSAINSTLSAWLPGPADVLEIASGSGQHAQYLCSQHANWTWQPTDADPHVLPAIALRCEALPGVRPPMHLDVAGPDWPLAPADFDVVYCANLLHISPEASMAALMRGAAVHLRAHGWLALYGPFLERDVATAPGNLAFDADLRARNPLWGLRQLDVVCSAAQTYGLMLEARQTMPANNLLLRFKRLS